MKVSLMLPCPISVYVQRRKTSISILLPTSIARFFPNAGIDGVGGERGDKDCGRSPLRLSKIRKLKSA